MNKQDKSIFKIVVFHRGKISAFSWWKDSSVRNSPLHDCLIPLGKGGFVFFSALGPSDKLWRLAWGFEPMHLCHHGHFFHKAQWMPAWRGGHVVVLPQNQSCYSPGCWQPLWQPPLLITQGQLFSHLAHWVRSHTYLLPTASCCQSFKPIVSNTQIIQSNN